MKGNGPGRCIWCLGEAGGNHVEHILPENLGCPPQLVLDSSWICQPCNNRLGHLDQAVSDDFDILAFMLGIRRKGGVPPVVSSRGNVFGSYLDGEPSLSFNMSQRPTTAHDGSYLAPYHGRSRNIKATLDPEKGELKFTVSMSGAPKFVRGIHKIALETFTYYRGEEAFDSAFDPIRAYVREGGDWRPVLLLGEDDGAEKHVFNHPQRHREEGSYCVTFRIISMRFIVDMSPTGKFFPGMVDEARAQFGEVGWTTIPPSVAGAGQ